MINIRFKIIQLHIMKYVTLFFDLEEAERKHSFNQEKTIKKIMKSLRKHNIKAVFNTTGTVWVDNNMLELGQTGHEYTDGSSQTTASHTFTQTLSSGTYEWNCLGENSASETAWGEPSNRIIIIGNRADNDGDGCIENVEVFNFMDRWRVSIADVSMREMMEAIDLWKRGVGCP